MSTPASNTPSRRDLANAIRFLAADSVQAANSGHPGMPMGMDDIAEAGRGLPSTAANDWYQVSDRVSITAALRAITSQLVSCDVKLSLAGTEDLSRIRVELVIDGVAVAIARGGSDGWRFTPATATVTLLGASCRSLQMAVEQGKTASVRARGIGMRSSSWIPPHKWGRAPASRAASSATCARPSQVRSRSCSAR